MLYCRYVACTGTALLSLRGVHRDCCTVATWRAQGLFYCRYVACTWTAVLSLRGVHRDCCTVATWCAQGLLYWPLRGVHRDCCTVATWRAQGLLYYRYVVCIETALLTSTWCAQGLVCYWQLAVLQIIAAIPARCQQLHSQKSKQCHTVLKAWKLQQPTDWLIYWRSGKYSGFYSASLQNFRGNSPN